MSDDHILPPPFAAVVNSLLAGKADHASLLRMPNLSSRNFWVGAAIGVGAVLLLKSAGANAATAPRAARGDE